MKQRYKTHKLEVLAEILHLRLVLTTEPTTGQYFAYIGHDNGFATSANTCSTPLDTKEEALNDLLLRIRYLIDHGVSTQTPQGRR